MNAFWDGDNVVTIHRAPDGSVRTHTVRAEYTCFIRQSDLSREYERKLREYSYVRSMQREGSWWRLRWRRWKALKWFAEKGGPADKAGIPVYEGDVNPVRRFLTDNDVRIVKPLRCYVDLEVDSRKPIAVQVEGESRILSWALCDDAGEKVYGVLEADTDEAEALLLRDLWDELFAYDQVCAWGGDRYDFPVLTKRSAALGLDGVEPRRWLWLDHLEVYKRFNMSASDSGDEKESVALDRVAQAVLGRGKHEFDTQNTWDAWVNDRETLVDYNVEDVVLMRDIEAATGYLDLHFTVCEACNTLPDSRGTNPTNFVEGYMLKLGLQHDQHFPTKFEVNYQRYEGAYVMEPTKTGLLKDVHVCDFASLYPSVILSWNMSPETLRGDAPGAKQELPSYMLNAPKAPVAVPAGHCVAPLTEKVFSTAATGMLPLALGRLLELRSEWKQRKASLPPGTPAWKEADRRSSAYKIAANSFYGVQGSVFSRFHERDVAESVTQAGKWLILETFKAANNAPWHFESVYGDTDSLFVTNASTARFQEFVDWCNAELYPRLLEQQGCPTNRIKLGYEKEFSRLVLVGKKRYAGRYAHYEGTAASADSKPEIKGLEYKRGDSVRLARQMQWEAVQMLLYEEVEDVEQYREWLRGWRERILEHTLPIEDVRLSQRLGKHATHYTRKMNADGTPSALPVHVEVALKMAERGLDVAEGVRIEYIVTDGRSPLTAVPATEYDGTNCDRFYLWENLVYPATMRLLQAAFPQHRWKHYHKVRKYVSGKARQDMLGQGLLFT